jgi:hypothetical protein
LSLDRFPEAFRRFEEVVDVDRIESYRQLKLTYASWFKTVTETLRRVVS